MRRRRRAEHGIDWGAYARSFGAAALALIGVLAGFYFTTKETLDRHEKQFQSIGNQFEKFNNTLQRNYDDWAKIQKTDSDKAEKVREKFLETFNSFGAQSAAMKVQVDNVSKQLDAVTNKLDSIQDVQRQDRRAPR